MSEIAGPKHLTLYCMYCKIFLGFKIFKEIYVLCSTVSEKNWFENFKSAEKKLDYTKYAVKAWIIL